MFGQKPEVTLDFTTNSWGLPTSYTKTAETYTSGDYSITFSATTSDGHKYINKGGNYLMMGKQNMSMSLSAFSFDVEKIEVVGNSGGSTATKQNIFVGTTAVSKETTGCTGTNTYLISGDYQKAGTIYTLKVTGTKSTQITKILIYKKQAADPIATKLSFGTDWDNQTITKKVGDDPFTRAAKLTSAVDGSEVNGDVTYKSDKPEVADVDKNGQVTVKAIGTAVITATFAGKEPYTESSISYTINVVDASKTVTTLSFGEGYDGKIVEIQANTSFTQKATLTPNVEGATITYSSSNTDVADVTNGEVLVYKAGDAIITAEYAGDDTHVGSKASYTIHATKVPVTIAFAKPEGVEYNYGAENGDPIFENVAKVEPTEAGTVKYEISAKSGEDIILAPEQDGTVLVNTKKIGSVTIKASLVNADSEIYEDPTPVTYTITVKETREKLELKFEHNAYSFNQGAEDKKITDNKLTAPEGVTVTYSSNAENIATVDKETGEVTVNTANVGTATITAIFAGNDTYAPDTISYTITVVSTATEATFDFTQSENDYGSGVKPSNDNNSDYVDASTWIEGNVTITTSKGKGSGFRWWINGTANELRAYKDSKLTVSVPDGYSINSIVVGGVNTGLDADCGTMIKGTWTGASQSVTFTPSGRRDIKSITVKYIKLESLTTAASGFATYTASYPVNYSELGLTAYAVKLNEAEGKVTYTKFTGVVPADKAVLVQGEAGKEYTLTPATGNEAEFDTDLKSSDGNATSDGKMYAFSTKNEKSGFYLVQSGVNIPSKKGYLQLTGTTSEAKPFFSFDGGNGTTGIAGVEADADTDWDNAVIYNLAGQRVSKSYKGVVIVNGKKMLRK